MSRNPQTDRLGAEQRLSTRPQADGLGSQEMDEAEGYQEAGQNGAAL